MDQTPFVPKKDLEENFLKIAALQENALIKRMKHIKAKRIVVGVSGGLDSTLALLIAVRVYDLLDLPRTDIIGVTMPGLHTGDVTKNHADALMKHLGITVKEIDIKNHTKEHFLLIDHDGVTQDIAYENTQARIRTTILMNLANKEQGIVLGTGDMSELVLGWCTYNGDQMSMYGINSGIPKTLVRFMITEYARFKFNEEIRHVLEGIVNTPITPELTEGQTTEETIGKYEINDFMIHRLFRFGDDEQRIVWLLEKTFDLNREESESYAHQFFTRFYSQQFKRQALPDGPKILDIGISPRGDLRLPSDIDYSF
jgi:NAD+ synthase (glutamine-hydrolysing)